VIRRGHGAVLAAQLRRGRVGWVAAAARRTLALELGVARGPLFATLAVTWRCNYRCTFCDLPDRARGDPPLATLVERLRLLKRRGALAVGITGGEPLLHPGLFELMDAARALGLLVHLNTNGSRLTAERVAPLLAAGLHSINVSLDGACAATHDALRGVPGSFAQIGATVAALLAARAGGSPRIGLVMAITASNWREVRAFARLAGSWGVDAAGFLPHHDFVAGEPLLSAARLSSSDAAELARELAAAAEECEVVDNSDRYLRGVAPFLAGAPTPVECSAPRSHLALDPDGVGYPCVPLMTLRRAGVPAAELEVDSRGSRRAPRPSAADREEVCRRCWWNCHRELDLTLRRIPAHA
jgi:MoaA/NifB/PqqE/SkfB family radical SAM enzyme